MIVDFGSCWVANLQEAGAPIKRDTILGTLMIQRRNIVTAALPATLPICFR
jgi:hypothetical protein